MRTVRSLAFNPVALMMPDSTTVDSSEDQVEGVTVGAAITANITDDVPVIIETR